MAATIVADSLFLPTVIIIVCGLLGLAFSFFRAKEVSRISLDDGGKLSNDERSALIEGAGNTAKAAEDLPQEVIDNIKSIYKAISDGAESFLWAEYRVMFFFMLGLAVVIFVALGVTSPETWLMGGFSTIAFVVGALTSVVSGYIGMKIAVYANARTALQARHGYAPAFNCAFKSGCVMGFTLVSLGMLMLYILINLFKLKFGFGGNNESENLFEAIAGYGLGGSAVALFGRVGGGIYTKAADVGADLVGKVEVGIPEDDPRNPAVIADNVGDNVGDIAGMGADLFGSFAESTCAALVISSRSAGYQAVWGAMMFPLLISATGIFMCILTSFVATNLILVNKKEDIEPSLKRQLLVSTVLMTPTIFLLTQLFLPATTTFEGFFRQGTELAQVANWQVGICVTSGLWAGLCIGYITEYFTSHAYEPVRQVADACKQGAATNVIFGLALGCKSTIIPVIALAVCIYVSYFLAHMYGVACAALGMLSTLSVGLTIDAYGPISDNAGGIAEMAGLGDDVRERTDALDAAGNTTAAIGKGFAIGSAALVSLALFGAYTVAAGIKSVDILAPFEFAGLLIGAMLPYAFSGMTMKSVGEAAKGMVDEVRRQFREKPGIMERTEEPDYKECVRISTEASLKEMIAPGCLVLLSPLFVGFVIGTHTLSGMLAGALVSGVQMAISSANTGGAWDNAKKYIESGAGGLGGKGSDAYRAAVIGDTVGDPLKDTSGPALNILIKLMAILSLVFAPAFAKTGALEYWALGRK